MGWLISIPMMLVGLIVKNDTIVTASAIFAVAGSIDRLTVQIKERKEKENNEETK